MPTDLYRRTSKTEAFLVKGGGKVGRRWIGIDISPKAVELVNMRLQQSVA